MISNDTKWRFYCWLYTVTHWEWVYRKLVILQVEMTVVFRIS